MTMLRPKVIQLEATARAGRTTAKSPSQPRARKPRPTASSDVLRIPVGA
jgi:hypothetical protein